MLTKGRVRLSLGRYGSRKLAAHRRLRPVRAFEFAGREIEGDCRTLRYRAEVGQHLRERNAA